MRLVAPAFAAALALTLAGCISMTPPPPPPPPPPGGTCNAANASFVVGQPATPGNVEAARQAAGASIVRVLSPGEVVTMEFAAGRLNLMVNQVNIITQATCG